MLITGIFVLPVMIDQRWSLLDMIASALGGVLAAIHQGTKGSGLSWFWWPLLLLWMFVALPFFLAALILALIVNGIVAVFHFVSRRLGKTLNAA